MVLSHETELGAFAPKMHPIGALWSQFSIGLIALI